MTTEVKINPSPAEKESFMRKLINFHEKNGIPWIVPKINGKDVDLYTLYYLVTSKGGWDEVSSKNKWKEIVQSFGILHFCLNGDVAIKQIYLRYFDEYEKVNFVEWANAGHQSDDIRTMYSKRAVRAVHYVPFVYNHGQHYFNDILRDCCGLSKDLFYPKACEKLLLSLISPLPNEQDFAINICTILSMRRNCILKLNEESKLLHFILAHAAVFSHSNLRSLFTEYYEKIRGYSFRNFWKEEVSDISLLRLLNEIDSSPSTHTKFFDDTETQFSSEVISQCNFQNGSFMIDESPPLWHSGILSTDIRTSKRVSQVATILKNLTFFNENCFVMAENTTFLRFVLLCCGSKSSHLQQDGWDMLGNIVPEISHENPLLGDVLALIYSGLLSEDKSLVLNSLDILNKLAQNKENENVLLKNLEVFGCERVLSFLALQDIELILYTLELLLSLSTLGRRACDFITGLHGCIDTFMSLITLNSQPMTLSVKPIEGPKLYQMNSSSNSTPARPASHIPASTEKPKLTPSQPQAQLKGIPVGDLNNEINPLRELNESEDFALAWCKNYFKLNVSEVDYSKVYSKYVQDCTTSGRKGVIAPNHFDKFIKSHLDNALNVEVGNPKEGTNKNSNGLEGNKNSNANKDNNTNSNGLKVSQSDDSSEDNKLNANGLKGSQSNDSNEDKLNANGLKGSQSNDSNEDIKKNLNGLNGCETDDSNKGINTNSNGLKGSQSDSSDKDINTNSNGLEGSQGDYGNSEININANGLEGSQSENGSKQIKINSNGLETSQHVVNKNKRVASDEPEGHEAKRRFSQVSDSGESVRLSVDTKTHGDTSNISQVPEVNDSLESRLRSSSEENEALEQSFVCGWENCKQHFGSSHALYTHACMKHCVREDEEGLCLWGNCDSLKRKRYALMTHFFERHCKPNLLRNSVPKQKTTVKGVLEPSPQSTPTRNYELGCNFMNSESLKRGESDSNNKELVTKSIQLTSALILRNLARYSINGPKLLIRFESHLINSSLCNPELSNIIAQILFENV